MTMELALFSAEGQIGRGKDGLAEFETCADLLAFMDRLGVSRALAWNVEARDGPAMQGNRRLLAEIDALGPRGSRLVPSFVVAPSMLRDPKAMDELAEHFRAGRVKAIRVVRPSLRHKMRVVEPLIRQVERYAPAVLVDVREDPDGHDLLALAEAFPQTPFICLHGRWPRFFGLFDLVDVLSRVPNVIVASTWLHTQGIFEKVAENFGPQRLVFSTGLQPDSAAAVGALAYAKVSQEIRDCVAHGNLDRLLGLPPTPSLPLPEIGVEVTRTFYEDDDHLPLPSGPKDPIYAEYRRRLCERLRGDAPIRPPGPLCSEYRRKGGHLHGVYKHWHRNGVLAFEGLYELGNPVSGCYWDKRGREICRYELHDGTGTEITVFQGGARWDGARWETPWVSGKKHGIENHRSTMGRITSQALWLRGKNVNLEKYKSACEVDPTLPKWTMPNEGEDPNQWALDILAMGNTYEAIEWLEDRARGEATLGEGWTWKKSVSTIRKLCALGAAKVYVFDVDEETRNSGRLLIELPDDADKRAAVLGWCNRMGAKKGFDREPDEGQRYTLVMLD